MKIIGVIKIVQEQRTLLKLNVKGLLKNLLGLPLNDSDVEKRFNFPGRAMPDNVVIDPEDEYLTLGEKVQEIRFTDYTLNGVLPVREVPEGWECAVDRIEPRVKVKEDP